MAKIASSITGKDAGNFCEDRVETAFPDLSWMPCGRKRLAPLRTTSKITRQKNVRVEVDIGNYLSSSQLECPEHPFHTGNASDTALPAQPRQAVEKGFFMVILY
jgi:hypothetical protein